MVAPANRIFVSVFFQRCKSTVVVRRSRMTVIVLTMTMVVVLVVVVALRY